jgi:NAD(P)-dependent dehydrogenase (short-subunit alcohol dehydrogenase family)
VDELRGRVAWVTGGTRGIGLAVSRSLVAAGARVVLTGRDASAAAEIAEGLAADHPSGEAVGLAADVRDPASLRNAVAVATERFGRLDALVANAGVGRMAPIQELSEEDWREVIDTNLSGAYHSVRAALDALVASGGAIVTIGSLACAHAFAGGAAYNASKFGLVGFTEAIMHDLRDLGVRVATVMPGSVATDFSRRRGGDDAWKLQAEDVAEAVLFVLRNPGRALPSRIELRPARRRPSGGG